MVRPSNFSSLVHFSFFAKPEQIEKLSVWFPWRNKVELTLEAGLTGKGFIVECPTKENTWRHGKLGFAFSVYAKDKLEPAITVKTEMDRNPTGFERTWNFNSYLSATHKFSHSWHFDLSDIKLSPETLFNIKNGFLVIGIPEFGIALRRIEFGASKWTFFLDFNPSNHCSHFGALFFWGGEQSWEFLLECFSSAFDLHR